MRMLYKSLYSQIVILIVCLMGPQWTFANPFFPETTEDASSLFETQDYEKSVEAYRAALERNSDSAELKYNLGTALYKLGDFEEAKTWLLKGLLSEDEAVVRSSQYNLGNTHFQLGREALASNPQQANELWKEALSYYQALLDEQNDPDAKYNYDTITKMLEALEQQQQESKPQTDKKGEDENKQNREDQNSSQQNQDQNQSQGQSQPENQNQSSPSHQSDSSESTEQNAAQTPSDESSSDSNTQNQTDSPSSSAEDQNEKQQISAVDSNDDESDDSTQDESSEESQNVVDEKQNDAQNMKTQDNNAENSSQESSQSNQNTNMMVAEGELTQQEARQLIQSFKFSESPDQLFPVFEGQGDQRPVSKDW